MDDVESAILEAWARISPALLADQGGLTKRVARGAALKRRPPRAWCLAVRASDTRIPSTHCAPSAHPRQPGCPDRPQDVTFDLQLVLDLCMPVRIEPPGETIHEVATKLGVSVGSLLTSRVDGIFRTHHVKGLGGSRGWPVPLLYTDRPLDPGAKLFAVADPIWSRTIRYRLSRVPDDFTQRVTRVAYYRAHCGKHAYDDDRHPELDAVDHRRRRTLKVPRQGPDLVPYKWKGDEYMGYDWRNPAAREGYERHMRLKERRLELYRQHHKHERSTSGGSLHFNGWQWLCPACGKTCRTMYYPLPGIQLLHDVPAIAEPIDVPRRFDGFACLNCHRVHYLCRTTRDCWNDLVSYLSGGLLYGAEARRPAWFKIERKRAYAPRPNRTPSQRRPQVTEMLLEGLTYPEIGARLGLSLNTIESYAREIYAQSGVHSRAELARKLGRELPPRRGVSPLSANVIAVRAASVSL